MHLKGGLKKNGKMRKEIPVVLQRIRRLKNADLLKRFLKKTPRTWGSLSKSQKAKAVAEKKRVGMGRRTSSIRKRKTKKKK